MKYEDVRAKIAAKFRKVGFLMTLTQTFAGELDPVTGNVDGGQPFDWPVWGMKGSLGKISRFGDSTTKLGTTIETGDQLIIIEAGVVVPKVNDVLNIKGVKWRVLASDGLDPAGIDLLYQMHMRR